MKINAIKIENYKSFAETGWIPLGRNFTVLVGQNNAGKSAFLRAFSPIKAGSSPHRSSKRPVTALLPESRFAYRVEVKGGEHFLKALERGMSTLPTTREIEHDVMATHYKQDNEYTLEYSFDIREPRILNGPLHNIIKNDHESLISVARVNEQRNGFVAAALGPRSNHQDYTAHNLFELLSLTTFLFDAERFNVGRCQVQETSVLAANAANLPYMLFKLTKDHIKFEYFQELVRDIFPNITRILISPTGNEIEISVQSDRSYRQDLAVPLDQCGTGVAQVIAILYVVLAYDEAQIVIDEPNSFLHPGATRRLLNILKKFDNHQFVLTTHAPEVISVVEPEQLLLLTWNPEYGETSISASNGTDIEQVRGALNELGATVSDVFGFDVVVFVEGPTEVACFPLLVDQGNKLAINFVPMREASAFSARDPQELFDIYRRGVDGSAILPQVTSFSFDREGRTTRQIEDIQRSSKGDAVFLPGMMYESHLMHPAAIAALLNGLEGESGHTEVAVSDFLTQERPNYSVKNVPNTSLETCDAAKLIIALVRTLTHIRHQYDKIKHGKLLTEWLLANDAKHLEVLNSHVARLLDRSQRPD